MISLTTLVFNNTKLVIMLINLTCNIELKINVSWNNTPLDYGINERVLVYLVKQVPKNTDSVKLYPVRY